MRQKRESRNSLTRPSAIGEIGFYTMRYPKRNWHPNAIGTLTRIAYAHARASGIDPKFLLKQADLTISQIRNPDLRLGANNQINFFKSCGYRCAR
jgi:hypothetical protein